MKDIVWKIPLLRQLQPSQVCLVRGELSLLVSICNYFWYLAMLIVLGWGKGKSYFKYDRSTAYILAIDIKCRSLGSWKSRLFIYLFIFNKCKICPTSGTGREPGNFCKGIRTLFTFTQCFSLQLFSKIDLELDFLNSFVKTTICAVSLVGGTVVY